MAQSLEAKIVVLGSQGVGKTSLVSASILACALRWERRGARSAFVFKVTDLIPLQVQRYVRNQFSPASTTSTVGASFQTKKVVDDESDTVVRLQIWDTAGQERFRYRILRSATIYTETNISAIHSSISRLYYRGANACILCYSITDLSSFEEMGVWLTELRRNLPSDIILHVVGTKTDIVAREPSRREVPFERCIAYVAENLAPGQSSTPPATATTGLESVIRQGSSSTGDVGQKSPSSKRSSGFWGQEVGWDCCHEVSAESGEGVQEVFRVITRKLVEQNRKIQEQVANAIQSPGIGAGQDLDQGPYYDGAAAGGSFRVGRDRRSWFGVPVEVINDEAQGGDGAQGGQQVKVRRKCC
jgi:GTPase SAR1 family protein